MSLSKWLLDLIEKFSDLPTRRRFKSRSRGPSHWATCTNLEHLESRILLAVTATSDSSHQLLGLTVPQWTTISGAVMQAPGNSTQTVAVQFSLKARSAVYRSEFGIVKVDDAEGRIAGVLPSDPKYSKVAFEPGRWKVLLAQGAKPPEKSETTLPGGSRFILFGVQNGTVATHLQKNLNNAPRGTAPVFFSVADANPDNRFPHFRIASNGDFQFEDFSYGGDRDFNDAILAVAAGVPQGGAEPPAITARLTNDTGPRNDDSLTSDPSLLGTLDHGFGTLELFAALDDNRTNPAFQNVSSSIQNGGFALNQSVMQSLSGGHLSDGRHEVRLQAKDSVGQLSEIFSLSFLLDTSADVPTIRLLRDTGSSSSDRLTSDATMTGMASDRNGLALFEVAVKNGTTQSPFRSMSSKLTNGQFTLTRDDLATILGRSIVDGTYTVLTRTRDLAGNNSATASLEFKLDTSITAPPLRLVSDTGTSNTDRLTSIPSIQGTASDPNGLGTVEAAFLNGTSAPVFRPIGSWLVNGGFTLTASELAIIRGSAITDGKYSFVVRAKDRAGNVSGNSLLEFTLDSAHISPQMSLETDTGSSPIDFKTSIITILATAGDPNGLAMVEASVSSNGSPGAFRSVGHLLSAGKIRLTRSELETVYGHPLTDGVYSVTMRSRDRAGNSTTSLPLTITLDTRAPAISLGLAQGSDTAPVGDLETTTSVITLVGQTEPGLQVTLQQTGASVLADSGGQYTFVGVTLNAGANPFTVSTTDVAGNSGSASTSIELLTDECIFDDLTGWRIGTNDGSATGKGSVTVVGDHVVMREGDSFLVTLQQTFVIPSTPSELTVHYENLTFDTTDPASINDAFEMALVDASGMPLVHTIGIGRDAFFNISEGVSALDGLSTTITGTTITLSLSGIAAGTQATLILRLVNNDSDVATTVDIACVHVEPQSGPPAGGLGSPAGNPAGNFAATQQIDFARLSDITGSFHGEYARTSFDQDSTVLFTEIGVRNSGQFAVDAPLYVGVANISDPRVRVRNEIAITPGGLPLYDFTSLVPSGRLSPNGITGTTSLAFYNAERIQFTYDLVFFGMLNRAPVITSTPDIEALIGRSYQYDVDATDPDGDPLTFSLVTGPASSVVDSTTGLITWQPAAGDLGTHAVTVRVDDGRGGSSEQRYVLSVITAPPNRPPVFTSVPVVAANVNTQYAYDADATDPDGDTLVYSLLTGPTELEINFSTGQIQWTPSPNQVGTHDLSVRVIDGHGGIATQSFVLLVQQEPGNHPPIIVSDPITTAVGGQPYVYDVDALDPDLDPLAYSLTTAPAGMSINPATGEIVWSAPDHSPIFDSAFRFGSSGEERATVMKVDESGNVVIFGTFQGTVDFDPGSGVYNLSSIGSHDIFLAKYSANLELLWAKQIQSDNHDFAYDLSTDKQGNIYAAGYFNGNIDFDPGPGSRIMTSTGQWDGFVLKLDTNGGFLWSDQFAALGIGVTLGIAVDITGNVYATGWYLGTVDLDPGVGTFNLTSVGNADSYDSYIVKLSANGAFLWGKGSGGPSKEQGYGIAVDLAGAVYATGYFSGTVDFDPGPGVFQLTSTGGINAYVLKLDTDGHFVWADRFGGSGLSRGNRIAVDQSGNVYLNGTFDSTVDFDPGAGTYSITSTGGTDSYVVKLNNAGKLLWAKDIGGSGDDFTYSQMSIALNANGDVYTTGVFQGTVDFDPGSGVFDITSTGNHDGFGAKLDGQGNLVWAQRHGGDSALDVGLGNGVDAIWSVVPGPDDVVYMSGSFAATAQFGPNQPAFSMTSAGSTDGFLAKFVERPKVTVRVEDGRGGTDTQSFTIDILGNRPPEIVSQPVTDAFVGTTYNYDVDAVDPDNDTLRYSLSDSLPGMVIDPVTGEISWSPPPTPIVLKSAASFGSTGEEFASVMRADADGNVITFGTFQGTVDFDLGPGAFNLTSVGSNDMFIAKYSPEFDLLWAQRIQGNDHDLAYNLAVDTSGNIVAVGYFSGTADFDGGAGTALMTSAGGFDGFILKLTASGAYVWSRQIGGSGKDVTLGVDLDDVGNVYVTGYLSDTVDFDRGPGNVLLTSAGEGDHYVAKFDSTGNIVWARSNAGVAHDAANSIAVDASGSVYITGNFDGTVDFDPSPGTRLLTSRGGADGFIQKLDSNGNLLWVGQLGAAGEQQGRHVAVDPFGDVVAVGVFDNTVDFDFGAGTFNLTSAGALDTFIVKIKSDGTFIWAKRIGGTGRDAARLSLAIDAAGGVYTSGAFQNSVDFDPGAGTYVLTSGGSIDGFGVKLDRDGEFQWVVTIGGNSGYAGLTGIVSSTNRRIYVYGAFGGTATLQPDNHVFTTTSAGSTDGFLAAFTDEFSVTVRVDDNRGGFDTQGFTIDVQRAAPGEIRGTVFNDSNEDGLRTPSAFTITSSGSNQVLIYDPVSGAFRGELQSQAMLQIPDGIVLGPDGNYYVCSFPDRVLRYSGIDGAFIDTFVAPGAGGLDRPHSLTFGPDGNLYVNSRGTAKILRFNGRTGAFIDVFASGSGLVNSTDLTFGTGGFLYVSDESTSSVLQFDGRTGQFVGVFVQPGSGGLTAPHALTFGPNGSLFVSGTTGVMKYDGKTGAFLGVFVANGSGGLNRPTAIAFGVDGRAYISSYNNHTILRYDAITGAFIDVFIPSRFGGLNAPDFSLFVSQELGLPSWTVFLDVNGNGRRDAEERFTTTDALGNYSFPNLAPGTYIVAEEQQPGWVQTAPDTSLLSDALFAIGDGRSDNSSNLYRIRSSSTNPVAEMIGETGVVLTDLAVQPGTGRLFGISLASDLYELNSQTGVATRVGATTAPNLTGLEFSPDGSLYAMGLSNSSLYRLNVATGAGTIVFDTGFRANGDLAIDLDGSLYLASSTDQLIHLDLIRRTATVVGAFGIAAVPGIEIDREGNMFAGRNSDSSSSLATLYSINKTTGHATVLGQIEGTTQTGLWGMSFDESQIAHNGIYEIALGAGQVVPGIDFGNQQIAGPPVNHAPSFATNAPTSSTVGQLLRYNARATDTDNDPLAFDLVVKPNGMGIDPTSGIVVWVPEAGQEGAHDVILRVQDGRGGVALQSFEIVVTRENATPVITSRPRGPAVVGLPYQYQVTAQDADGDPVVFSLGAHPDGMTIHPTTGLLQWTPAANQVGSPHVEVIASDNRGDSTTQSFDLPTVATATDRSPEITSRPRNSVQLGATYLYAVQAFDPDGDPLRYSLPEFPVGMTIDFFTGLVTWVPTATQMGPHAVQVKVDDGRGMAVIQSFTVSVLNQVPNQAPTIVSTPPFSATVARNYVYDVGATDPDGDPLAFSLDTAPAGMSIDAALGTIRWIPTADHVGSQNVVVRVNDTQGGFATQSFTIVVRAVNVPPAISSTPPTFGSVGNAYFYAVRASDVDGDALNFAPITMPAGMTIDPLTGLIEWTPLASQLGSQGVAFRVDDGQGGVATQVYTIVVTATANNHPPVVTSTPPFLATLNAPYRYEVTATDPDGDALTFQLLTRPDGMSINENTGIVTWTPTALQLGRHTVTVAAVDGQDVGTQTFTIDVAGVNQAPTITSSPSPGVVAGLTYRYDVRATDPDGDPIGYSLDTAPAGMTIDGFGRILWPTTKVNVGTHRVAVSVEDNRGMFVTQTFDMVVLADGKTPRVNLIVNPDLVVAIGSTVTFIVTATDNVGVTSVGLTINGSTVPLDASGRISLIATPAGSYEIVASASDDQGNTGLASTTLLVFDNSDQNPPQVDVTSPLDGTTIYSPIDVIGTVTDDNLVFYTLSVAQLGSSTFTELFRGTTPVTNGVLGKFDPTGLVNDSYILRLEATDIGGNTSYIDTTVNVAGDLKIGNFTLSFTDLTIPVSGIPISVSRTYDSLQAGTQDDFGFGWRLEFRDTDLRTSVPKTSIEDQEVGVFTPYRKGSKVYITLPGGKREGFTFDPVKKKGFAGLFNVWDPKFVPDRGVTSHLSVLKNYTLIRTEQGDFMGAVNGGTLAFNPEDSLNWGGLFYLTTQDGVGYEIDARTGDLNRISDMNGNVLSFTDTAITSNQGPRVTFERDPQNRVVAVLDPQGNRIRYEYDVRGDLVKVTDREGNATQFVYDKPLRPHFLTEIIDPLGRSGVRTDYDDSGRLIKLLDAAGNPVQIVHDPNNSLETVTDALGNSTTFEYDVFGNVITEFDALGKTTRRTYDGANNMLTETDALGQMQTFTYDSAGNVLTTTDALGNITRNTYTTHKSGFFGRASFGAAPVYTIASTTDPLGNTTTYEYSVDSSLTGLGAANLISTTDAAGNKTRYTYDDRGNQTTITDAGGFVTTFEYVGANLSRQVDALGNATTFTYDTNGNQLTQTSTLSTPGGVRTLVTSTEYDASGRPVRVTDAEGNATRTIYDALGNQVAAIDALGRRTDFTYDNRGQLIGMTFPDGTFTATGFDVLGRRTSSTDRDGTVTYFVYDPLGRLTETILPDSTPGDLTNNPRSKTEYDEVGRLKAQIDERGNKTEFEYDDAGRQTVVRNALGLETTTTYDVAGRSLSVTDALGRTTHFAYDTLGRQTETTFADGTSTSTNYDPLGRAVAQTDQAGKITQFEYDRLGRLTAVIDALSQRTEYGYDEAGNLITQRDANGHVTR